MKQPEDDLAPTPPSHPGPRGPRWLRRLAVLAGVLFAAALFGSWGWSAYEERALNRRLDAIRQAGEPVTPADLATLAVPEAENAAAAFRAAARSIDTETTAWAKYDEPYSPTPQLPLWANERVTLEAVLAENRKALSQAEHAAGLAEADWGLTLPSPMIGAPMPDLTEQRRLAGLLRADGLLALDAGDLPRALRRIEELLSQSRALDRHPTLIAHLVSLSLSATAADLAAEVARDLAAGKELTPAARAQVGGLVDRLLDEQPLREGLARAFQHERVMQVDAITAVADGRLEMEGSTRSTRGPGAAPGSAPQAAGSRLRGVRRAWMLRNASGGLDQMDRMIAAARTSADWPAFEAKLVGEPSAVERSPRFYMVARMLTAAVERTARQNYKAIASRRMSAVALAVALYASEHDDRLPKTLAELVPKYLPAVPLDPIAGGGKLLGYVPDGDRPRVYNVGENGVDDGGRPIDPMASRSENNRLCDEVLDLKRQPRLEPEPEEMELSEFPADPDAQDDPDAVKLPE